MVWFFDRNGERVRYEVRRAPGRDEYELRVTFPDGRVQSERIAAAAELLERCAAVAQTLKADGWRAV